MIPFGWVRSIAIRFRVVTTALSRAETALFLCFSAQITTRDLDPRPKWQTPLPLFNQIATSPLIRRSANRPTYYSCCLPLILLMSLPPIHNHSVDSMLITRHYSQLVTNQFAAMIIFNYSLVHLTVMQLKRLATDYLDQKKDKTNE